MAPSQIRSVGTYPLRRCRLPRRLFRARYVTRTCAFPAAYLSFVSTSRPFYGLVSKFEDKASKFGMLNWLYCTHV